MISTNWLDVGNWVSYKGQLHVVKTYSDDGKEVCLSDTRGGLCVANVGDIDRPEKAELYLTPHEAAARLRCTRRHVTNLINDGKLKASKISPRITRIKQSDLEAFINERNS